MGGESKHPDREKPHGRERPGGDALQPRAAGRGQPTQRDEGQPRVAPDHPARDVVDEAEDPDGRQAHPEESSKSTAHVSTSFSNLVIPQRAPSRSSVEASISSDAALNDRVPVRVDTAGGPRNDFE